MDATKDLLEKAKTIAVVGLSPRPDRYSNIVARYLMNAGYKVIPVNPMADEILGMKSYASLLDVPEQIDIVDVFRRSEFTPQIVNEAAKIGASVVWLQEGVSSNEAAKRARAQDMRIIMDTCLMKEHKKAIG
ncbi:MAG: CoA-binding protein [Terriglobia bacterium]